MKQHISSQFDEELESIRSKVLTMGGLVEKQLNNAIKSLIEGDIKLAEKVINNEIEINTYEVSIDQECVQILVRRQPAAGNLRFVMAVSKTITDLERVGDEAEKIAKMSIDLIEKKEPKPYYISIKAMGTLVSNMLRNSLDSFARIDAKRALDIAAEEPKSDEQYDSILRQLMTYMTEDVNNIEGALDAIWVVRSLERIGDHARNICEAIIYLVEGKDIRHTTLEKLKI